MTGVYVGGDGAYHELLGRSLNPGHGMAQTEADFAANYRRSLVTIDPATFRALHPPPPKSLSWGVEAALFVGNIVVATAAGIAVTLLTGNPILGAAAGGAVLSLFDYTVGGLVRGEHLTWGGALKATLLGGVMGVATFGVCAAIGAGVRLLATGIARVGRCCSRPADRSAHGRSTRPNGLDRRSQRGFKQLKNSFASTKAAQWTEEELITAALVPLAQMFRSHTLMIYCFAKAGTEPLRSPKGLKSNADLNLWSDESKGTHPFL